MLAHVAAYHSLGYGSATVSLRAGRRYRVMVYNWRDTSVDIDATLSSYAHQAVAFS